MSDWFGNWFGQWFGRSAGESLPSGAATFSVGATGALSAIGQLSGTAGLTLGTTGALSVPGLPVEPFSYYAATSSGDPIDDDELMELAAMLVASGALDQPRRSHHGLA